MGSLSPVHWLIVIGVVVLLFGAKKLPDMARAVGQSARVLKGEMRGLREDDRAAGTPPRDGGGTAT
ncbi:Sec-independent protein translocase subunit TatA [Pseudonocardia sp. RS11V-5]|uniref:Sec-independent protein translocase subunit TatA n=1 Tax=Pseudonocardia terrae TaxID=2905831 RepID=UPI001E54BF46|nr:Sec-independent protein translocase subunit TatA [Pseudonocardia terrae]MCE3554079.1 Sec-independent protein translocase subunit TatA [Pseudonocardia terrae]